MMWHLIFKETDFLVSLVAEMNSWESLFYRIVVWFNAKGQIPAKSQAGQAGLPKIHLPAVLKSVQNNTLILYLQ